MTNRLELNWKLDGFVDEQRYYCSETPIDINNLPTPKAVLAGDVRTHTDTSVSINKTYNVAISSVKNSVEKLSQVKSINTISYLLNMPFSQDINDHGKFGLQATIVGTAAIQNDYLYVPAGSYLTFNTAGLTELNLGTADFEFGIEVALMPTEGGSYPCLFGVGTAWGRGAISMQFNPSSRFMCAIMNTSEKDAFSPTDQTRDGTTFVKYVVKRISGVWKTYKDGVAGTALTDKSFIANFAKDGKLSVGAAIWDIGITSSHSKIKNVYLRKL